MWISESRGICLVTFQRCLESVIMRARMKPEMDTTRYHRADEGKNRMMERAMRKSSDADVAKCPSMWYARAIAIRSSGLLPLM